MAINPADYNAPQQVILPAPTSSISGFIFVINEDVLDSAAFAEARSDGGDFRICTDAAGTNQLPLHVKNYDNATNKASLWSRLPTYDSLNRTVYIFWGNATASQPAAGATFGSQEVYQDCIFYTHDGLTDETGGTVTISGVTQSAVESPNGLLAGYFSSAYVEKSITPLSEYTISAWYRPRSKFTNGSNILMMQESPLPGQQSSLIDDADPADIGMFNNTDSWLRSGVASSLATWQKCTARGSQTNSLRSVSINGAVEVTGSITSAESVLRDTIRLGRADRSGDPTWDVDADYAHAYIRAEYISDEHENLEWQNQNSPASFFTGAVTPSFALSGGVSNTSANITGRMSGASSDIQIEYADNLSFTGSVTTGLLSTDSDLLVKTTITGLSTATQYYYRFIDIGVTDSTVFSFKTSSSGVPYSFSLAFGGCARQISTQAYQRIKDRNPDFFMGLGDLSYFDTEEVTGATQKAGYFSWLAQSDVRLLTDNMAYAYTWDDHDYGDDNSTGANPAKTAHQANYRNIFPNYSLRDTSGSIDFSFTWGRVKFIVPDLRSERGDIASQQMISAAQMTWFKNELTSYANNNDLKFCVICSSVQWTDNTRTETWSRAPAQRTELTDHIVSLGIDDQICVIASNLHAMGADSGVNNVYGTGGTGGFPHYVGSPMAATSTSETDTGEYDLGLFGTSNGGSLSQYGVLEITDTASQIDVTFRGFNADTDTQLLTDTTTVPISAPPVLEGGFTKIIASSIARDISQSIDNPIRRNR